MKTLTIISLWLLLAADLYAQGVRPAFIGAATRVVAAAPAPSFTKDTVSGCAFFSISTTLSQADSSEVTSWGESVVGTAWSTPAGSTAPTFSNSISSYFGGKPFIHTDGSNDYLTNSLSSWTTNGAIRVFVVANVISGGYMLNWHSSTFMDIVSSQVKWSGQQTVGLVNKPVLYDNNGYWETVTTYTNGVLHSTPGIIGAPDASAVSIGRIHWGGYGKIDIAFMGVWTNISDAEAVKVRTNLNGIFNLY